MSNTSFSSISSSDLSHTHGGQNPPTQVTGRDVAEVGAKATLGVLNPRGLVKNVGQAYNQFNDPRIKDAGIGIRALNGFTGLFGIDPLKGRP
jgi:hypothetical protein